MQASRRIMEGSTASQVSETFSEPLQGGYGSLISPMLNKYRSPVE